MKIRIIIACSATLLLMGSCAAHMDAHEFSYVDDPEMGISQNRHDQYQKYIFSIREGSAPTATKKGNGGCGCN